jgi:hypothetical protein
MVQISSCTQNFKSTVQIYQREIPYHSDDDIIVIEMKVHPSMIYVLR